MTVTEPHWRYQWSVPYTNAREILRRHGPGIARPKEGRELSFGIIAVTVLNRALRPLLATWHPTLAHYESQRPPDVSAVEHERRWDKAGELRRALEDLKATLRRYAELLAEVAGVPPLTAPPTS